MSADFWKLPSKRFYPDYYKMIKNPISLLQIRTKIKVYIYIYISLMCMLYNNYEAIMLKVTKCIMVFREANMVLLVK